MFDEVIIGVDEWQAGRDPIALAQQLAGTAHPRSSGAPVARG
jgi:hypothetical protein